jgi:TorA maturation chaperone TorD
MNIRPPTAPSLPAQADLLLLLADLLRDPRDTALPSAEDVRDLCAAACEGDPALAGDLDELFAAARETPIENWRAEYHRLFEGSMACPPNEAMYIRRDKGAILADLSGFYMAFGMELASGTGERPDHIRCELEYLAILLWMLFRARESAEADHQDVTLAAMRDFIDEHLGAWIDSFTTRLASTASLHMFSLLAPVTARVVRHVAKGLELPMPDAPAIVDPLLVGEEDLTCGLPSPAAITPCTVSARSAEDR